MAVPSDALVKALQSHGLLSAEQLQAAAELAQAIPEAYIPLLGRQGFPRIKFILCVSSIRLLDSI